MIDSVVPRIAWRIALCAAVSWAVWRFGGLVPMVATAPLWGVLLARPLIDLASELRHRLRRHVWRPLEGRHFAYRGTPVQVLEDADHRRWVRAADVRRIIGFTTSDGALAFSYPSGWRALGRPAEPHFSDDALLAHLAKESSPEALRLRHWVERVVAFPARRVRKRLGIRTPAPGAPLRD
ncbi:MAG TPA: hypothetical protein VNU71_15755 [Burkholderiaceae bacterium]|nr:hypothetical protein [Burkholderiaceae bacterium]